MESILSCECGKQLRTQEKLAGKRIGCPACGRNHIIPGQQPVLEELTPGSPKSSDAHPSGTQGRLRTSLRSLGILLVVAAIAYLCGSIRNPAPVAATDSLVVPQAQAEPSPPTPVPSLPITAAPTPTYTPDPPRVIVEKPSITFEPKIEIAAAPPKRSADIIIRNLVIASSNPNGSAWDASGPPDLKVYIEQTSLFGSSHTTEVLQDVYSGDFQEKSIRVTEGDKIRIIVYDADVFDDDEVGRYDKLITADTLRERNVDWSFGGVISLRLEFQP